MREIKFRAWDSVNGEMTTPNETLDILISMDNKVFALMKEDNCSLGEVVRESTVIMQYTGLKDKNGTEIYEGDIIKLIFVNDDIFVSHLNGFINEPSEDDLIEIEYLTVYFNNRFGTYCISNIEKKKRVNEDEYFPDSSNILAEWNKECEVIGNIYENPELLERE